MSFINYIYLSDSKLLMVSAMKLDDILHNNFNEISIMAFPDLPHVQPRFDSYNISIL